MTQSAIAANPFQLMLDPASVLSAIEKSDALGRLNSRLCRPLDKPVLGARRAESPFEDDGVDTDVTDAE